MLGNLIIATFLGYAAAGIAFVMGVSFLGSLAVLSVTGGLILIALAVGSAAAPHNTFHHA